MSTRNQQPSLHTLLAPSRLVTGLILRSGHDMGVAATISGKLTLEFPEFELAKDDLTAAERALDAVDEAHAVWRRNPGWRYTIAERLRDHQDWLAEVRAAAAEGDRCLPALLRRGFVLAVTTSHEGAGMKAEAPKRFNEFPAPTYPYSAAVSVQRVPYLSTETPLLNRVPGRAPQKKLDECACVPQRKVADDHHAS